MWFERDLPRLNVLLELLEEWVRVGTHEALFTLLGRVKWVVDYASCFVVIDEAVGGGVFGVGSGGITSIPTHTVPAAVSLALASIRSQRRMLGLADRPNRIVGAPLATDGNFLGVIVFVARDSEPYGQQDIRFVEAIADYFAGAWWRIALREREQQQSLENRRKDEFLALLGHELRNPLAPMITALELMRGGHHHVREREVLERQVRHMTRLVDDLMDVARITRGKLEITRGCVLVRDVLSSAIEMIRPTLEVRNQLLLVEQSEAALCVSGDFARLSQIITNLLTNAVKFSPTLSTIRVRVEDSSARLRVLVTDEGKGIDGADLASIFEPFVQVGDRGLDRPGGGLGLGLSLARELARAHGGELSARSDGLGLGATFVLDLPQATIEDAMRVEAPSTPLQPHGSVPRPRVRVLLVDDNVDAAEMLTYMLQSKGFEIRVAHDGPSALREAAEFDPEVGILDIGLPGMNGFELAASIRRDPARAHMRLVALTGYGRESDIAKGRENGFDAHLVKPVDFAALEKWLGPQGHSSGHERRA